MLERHGLVKGVLWLALARHGATRSRDRAGRLAVSVCFLKIRRKLVITTSMMSIVNSVSALTPVLTTSAQNESGSALTYFEERTLTHFVPHFDARRGHQYVV